MDGSFIFEGRVFEKINVNKKYSHNLMVLFEDFIIEEGDIRKNIVRGTKIKRGKTLGYYKVKKHRKIYYYIPKKEKGRVAAKLKAINDLKYQLWHGKYILDFPNITEEFLHYLKKIDIKLATKKLLSISQFDRKVELIKQTDREKDLRLLYWEHIERRKLFKLFVSEFGYLLEDRDSKISKGAHGRFCYIPAALKRLVIDRDKKTCQHCGVITDDYQIDHIIPITYGGPCHKWNLQFLCRNCNQQKLFSITLKDGLRALNNLGYTPSLNK